jgi:hypothetical protein
LHEQARDHCVFVVEIGWAGGGEDMRVSHGEGEEEKENGGEEEDDTGTAD